MKRFTILMIGILLPALAMAEDECSVDLHYDIQVSTQALKVSKEGETLYQILQGGLLSVRGEAVALTGDQTVLAEEYAGEVAALVIQWVVMIPQALKVAEESVAGAFTAAFGQDSAPVTAAAIALKLVRETFERSVTVDDGVYSISMSEFNHIEEAMGEELTKELEEIEAAIMSSLGSLFVEFGQAVVSTEGSFEERMGAFGARIDRVDRELGRLAQELEDTSAELCAGRRKVQSLERRIVREIPELADYLLFAA